MIVRYLAGGFPFLCHVPPIWMRSLFSGRLKPRTSTNHTQFSVVFPNITQGNIWVDHVNVPLNQSQEQPGWTGWPAKRFHPHWNLRLFALCMQFVTIYPLVIKRGNCKSWFWFELNGKTIYKDGWFPIATIDCRRVFVNDVLMCVCQYHPTCEVLLQYLFLLVQSLYCHAYVR